MTLEKVAQCGLEATYEYLMMSSVNTTSMETINRTDFTALETITMILRELGKTKDPDFGDYDWAIDMIAHEIQQTGRQI